MAPKTIVYYILVSGFSDTQLAARRAVIQRYVPADLELRIVSDPSSPGWAATSAEATGRLTDYAARCDPSDVAAVVVSGALDPGVHEARRVAPVPIVGAGEASLAVAAAINRPLSLIVIDEPTRIAAERMVTRGGTQPAIVSIRSTETPADELVQDHGRVRRAVMEQATAAVRDDGAKAVLLACMLFSELDIAGSIRSQLSIPVVDPLPVGMSTAVACARAMCAPTALQAER